MCVYQKWSQNIFLRKKKQKQCIADNQFETVSKGH